MIEIKLTQGKTAFIDDEDEPIVAPFKWRASQVHPGVWYATAKVGRKTIYMHKLLLATEPGYRPDHRDGNGLNNCRANLRPATPAQNSFNRSTNRAPHSSQYKGVTWAAREHKWRAQIMKAKKNHYLGAFNSELDAAIAYNSAAAVMFVDFARLNQVS